MVLHKLLHAVMIGALLVSGGSTPSALVLARTTTASTDHPASVPSVSTVHAPAALVPAASNLPSAPIPPVDDTPLSPVVSHSAPVPVRISPSISAAPLLLRTLDSPASQPLPVTRATHDPAPFGPLPLTFIPVPHAMDTLGDFILGAGAQPITFTTSGPIFTLPAAAIPPSTGANSSNIHDIHDVVLPTQTTLPVDFIGANRLTQLFGDDRLSGIANIYDFTGHTPSREGLPMYRSLTYQWLYPGIDLTYSGAHGALKSTYTVAPGADPGHIRWHYQHPATVQLREDGSLAVGLALTHATPPLLIEHAPIAWQERFGEHIPVPIAYELAADGSISFAIGAYDSTQPLLIDPSITYTYVASNLSSGQAVKVDAQGMIYVLNKNGTGSSLLKLNPQLPVDQQLLYTSDFGSAPFFAEAVDAQGNVVLAGNVAATAQTYTSINGTIQTIRGYPARDTTGATDRDAFVVEVDANGALIPNRLVRIGGTRPRVAQRASGHGRGRQTEIGRQQRSNAANRHAVRCYRCGTDVAR